MSQRYEIKAVIHPSDLIQFEKWKLSSFASFKASYPSRKINNIYYDTAKFTLMKDNLSGVSARYKVRFRWYEMHGERSDISAEYKIKLARLGKKETYRTSLSPESHTLLRDAEDAVRAVTPLDRIRMIHDFRYPVIRNQYIREYYESMNGHIRLTLDRENRHSRMIHSGEQLLRKPHRLSVYAIMELKFAPEHEQEAADIVKNLPFRISRHSKYLLAASEAYSVPYF